MTPWHRTEIEIGDAESHNPKGENKLHMNRKMKTIWGRIGIIATLVVLLATVLTGCATKSSTSTKPTVGELVLDRTYEGKLGASQLRAVANLLSETYNSNDFQTTNILLAASRHYNMLKDGFDDKTASNTDIGPDDPVESAKALIAKANEKAEDNVKVAESDYENLNENDIAKLVELFSTEVDVTPESGLQRTIGKFLSWLTRYLGFGSYIVGICIFALLVEIIMIPFAIKQQKNSVKQAMLKPKEMAIRKKYAGRNDQPTMQKVQQEIQEMYQKENFSPYSGCLPLLIQFPIIIVLYNIIIDPLRYVLGQSAGISSALSTFYSAPRAAGGLGNAISSSRGTIELLSGGIEQYSGIQDFGLFKNGSAVWDSLSAIGDRLPNFNIGPFNFGLNPSLTRFDILLLVPVLTFVVYFFSTKLTRKFSGQTTQEATDRQTACSNTMMDISMPAMSTVFTFMVPAIVGVYWMFRSVVGILKSFIMSKVIPLPKFTEEDYKNAERELKGKSPKTVEKSEKAGMVRSLHHIDDEDFDDTRDAALARKAAMKELADKQQAEKAEQAKKSTFGVPLMKKDRKSEKAEEKAEENSQDGTKTAGENDTNDGQAK